MNKEFHDSRNRWASLPTVHLSPAPVQDFAPHSPKKKPSFSPETSPETSSPSWVKKTRTVAEPTENYHKPLVFTQADADRLNAADREKHVILRAQRRFEYADIIQRSEARHERIRSPDKVLELQKMKERWKELRDAQQPLTSIYSPGVKHNTPKREGPQLTGVALLLQRGAENAEIAARIAERPFVKKIAPILDLRMRTETELMIAQHVAKRARLALKRERGVKVLQASMTRTESVSVFESCGVGEIVTPPEILAAEKEKKHNDTVSWMLTRVESIRKRVRQDDMTPIQEERHFPRRIDNVLALDTLTVYNVGGNRNTG